MEIESIDAGSQPVTGNGPAIEVSEGYLESIGGRALAGRLFAANDYLTGGAPVAIVNQQFVERWLAGRSPLGRRIRLLDGNAGWREIIGVVPDLGFGAGDPQSGQGLYVPMSDRTEAVFVAIRSSGNPNTFAGPLRRIVAEIDPKADVRFIRTLEDAGRELISFLTGVTAAMSALGVMALVMSLVSIYALLSFMVPRRTREIGIRVALGARRSQVLATVAGRASVLLAVGAAIGTVLGMNIAGFQSVILVNMPAIGVATPLAVVGALALAGLAAAWIPTRRALSIKPSEALASD